MMLIGQGISAIVNKVANFKYSNFLFNRQLTRVLSLQKNRAKYDPIKCVMWRNGVDFPIDACFTLSVDGISAVLWMKALLSCAKAVLPHDSLQKHEVHKKNH